MGAAVACLMCLWIGGTIGFVAAGVMFSAKHGDQFGEFGSDGIYSNPKLTRQQLNRVAAIWGIERRRFESDTSVRQRLHAVINDQTVKL
jgi:hypothetical protein